MAEGNGITQAGPGTAGEPAARRAASRPARSHGKAAPRMVGARDAEAVVRGVVPQGATVADVEAAVARAGVAWCLGEDGGVALVAMSVDSYAALCGGSR